MGYVLALSGCYRVEKNLSTRFFCEVSEVFAVLGKVGRFGGAQLRLFRIFGNKLDVVFFY